MSNQIAIVGFACRYPDADDPEQLWENILSKRSAFRAMPSERLNPRYFNIDKTSADQIYSNKVAVLKNYQFERSEFKISNSNYLSADLTHWISLEVAAEALRNSKLNNLSKKEREKTGVIIGNTLTGEFSRANLLRLRWPYVYQTLATTLTQELWDNGDIDKLLTVFEKNFKKSFPPMEEDSLAGGLSNTIAGRICNYFDFKGGGFTIDGACSSSLLALSKACDEISNKNLIIALVGGVDLSLDPFELVGFSRAGALASKDMLVYDKNSNGFFPGEGCGFIALTDFEFARQNDLNILGNIRGWGISSDGKGGLTRPGIEGQMLALERAYERAGYGLESVSYIEGHGTGTQVGDETELKAIINTLQKNAKSHHIYISSVKANIGHTKAAAGIAGIIKGLLVINRRIIPPISGNIDPHPVLKTSNKLTITNEPILFTEDRPLRIGVSSMGFGGINVHVTIEENSRLKKEDFSPKEIILKSSYQDAELFLIAANGYDSLFKKLTRLLQKVKILSVAELSDLSSSLYADINEGDLRVAIVAETVEKLVQKIEKLVAFLDLKLLSIIDNDECIYFSSKSRRLRIGLLFPGQGSNDIMKTNGVLLNRFPFIRDLMPDFLKQNFFKDDEMLQTHIAQPAILSTSITAIKLLRKLGISACTAIGHSLGEFSSLYWSGMLKEEDVVELVKKRGKLMHDHAGVKGKMLAINLDTSRLSIENILERFDISLACVNSLSQVIFSGIEASIINLQQYCIENKIAAALLKTENAFHSNLMNELEEEFFNEIGKFNFLEPNVNFYSTVTGKVVKSKEDIQANLILQLSKPVLFYQAFQAASQKIDVWIEAGCESKLEKLVKGFSKMPVLPLELAGKSTKGILKLAGLLFANGELINLDILFNERFCRKLNLDDELKFISNPCETFFSDGLAGKEAHFKKAQTSYTANGSLKIADINNNEIDTEVNIATLVKTELSHRLKLPIAAITDENRMLDDFHLNSLYVGQLISDIAAQNNLNLTNVPLEYSNASVKEIVSMFTLLNKSVLNSSSSTENRFVDNFDGISSWIYPFEISLREATLAPNKTSETRDYNKYLIRGDAPLSLSRFAGMSDTGKKDGVLIFLTNYKENEIIQLLIDSITIIKNNTEIKYVVFVQSSEVVNGFAKSMFLEHPHLIIKVITINPEHISDELLKNEITNFSSFSEVIYKNYKRYIPHLLPIVSNNFEKSILPAEDDAIIVSGGAKGITFECIRRVGIETRCYLILIGRSDPENDNLLASNLNLLKNEGVRFKYVRLDIGDSKEFSLMINKLILENKKITGIIHGAGINNPKKIWDLTTDDFEKNLKPKIHGLRNLVKYVDIASLKFVITFGSIIAESGMNGNADYALSNQWLKNEITSLASKFPGTYFLNLEWSVWGGTGMGHDLGILEMLKGKGINSITLDEGINYFTNLLKCPIKQNNLVISGRYGQLKTILKQEREADQLYRFTEEILVYYKNLEIISQFTLSENTDLYLSDHMIDGQLIFPAVFGLEAMSQALRILISDFSEQLEFIDVKFSKPIILKKDQNKKIRIIIQRRNHNCFAAVLRDEETFFKIDHFSATIIFGNSISENVEPVLIRGNKKVDLNIENDFYNSLLFHKGVFKRISSFEYIDAYNCISKATFLPGWKYFSDFISENLILSDPSLNDAVLHGVQACVPHQTLLPKSIDKISFYADSKNVNNIIIKATEIRQAIDEYFYNIEVLSEKNIIIARWTGVKFQVLHQKKKRRLANEFLENVLRRKIDLISGVRSNYKINFYNERSGSHINIYKRSDGKPISPTANHCTISHSWHQTLELEADINVACDMESIINKPDSDWKSILGDNRFQLITTINEFVKEDTSISATRIWCAIECIRKAGLQLLSPLLISHSDSDSTVYFKIDNCIILTYTCIWKNTDKETVFAILIETNNEKV